MRKTGIFLLFTLSFFLLFSACAQGQSYKDGNYTAEFADYDNRGYKDSIRVTVKDSVVTSIEYDAINADGLQKSRDEKYAEDMRKLQETYPEKFSQDLVNQYLEVQKISEVDAVAGATYSSDAFIALFAALEPTMLKGDTETVVVENVPTI